MLTKTLHNINRKDKNTISNLYTCHSFWRWQFLRGGQIPENVYIQKSEGVIFKFSKYFGCNLFYIEAENYFQKENFLKNVLFCLSPSNSGLAFFLFKYIEVRSGVNCFCHASDNNCLGVNFQVSESVLRGRWNGTINLRQKLWCSQFEQIKPSDAKIRFTPFIQIIPILFRNHKFE